MNEGNFGQYDGEFLVLDEADRFTGDVIDLPASLCACVRFRGHHAESPAQYRRLMQFIREEGYTAAGFSREITVIDYGFTTDTEKFVTEIMIPLAKGIKGSRVHTWELFLYFLLNARRRRSS